MQWQSPIRKGSDQAKADRAAGASPREKYRCFQHDNCNAGSGRPIRNGWLGRRIGNREAS